MGLAQVHVLIKAVSLPRKSGSIYLSFPAQMCSLSSSNQRECKDIALHHVGNNGTLKLA